MLIGFTERSVSSVGIIMLHVNINNTMWELEFLVMDAPSSYDGIIRRTVLNKLKAVVSMYSSMVEIRIRIGPHTIKGDKHIGRECFIVSQAEAENSIAEEKMKKRKINANNSNPRGV